MNMQLKKITVTVVEIIQITSLMKCLNSDIKSTTHNSEIWRTLVEILDNVYCCNRPIIR